MTSTNLGSLPGQGTVAIPSNLPPPQFFVDHKKGEVNELK
jgi:hypothetical protein